MSFNPGRSIGNSTIYDRLKQEQENARKALNVMVTSVMYLARQGLAFRGNENDAGDFFELVKLRSFDVPEVVSWLKRRDKWMSNTIYRSS